MANFSLIGYVKRIIHVGGRVRLTLGEYIQGHRTDDGSIVGERMDMWYVFFPNSAARHLLRFKEHDLVIVKGTIHQSAVGSEYVYAVNGESIKHFYTRDLLDEIGRERKVDIGEIEISQVDTDFDI